MKRYQICGRFMSLAGTPKSKLNCTATINSLYDAFDNVKHMVDALVHSFTKRTYEKNVCTSLHNFNDLFLSWPDNGELSKTLLLSRFHQGQIMETAK